MFIVSDFSYLYVFIFRAHYIIDTKGILRHITMNDVQVTRDINEILRLVQAFQRSDENEKNILSETEDA